jgi:hypothetical protein
VAGLWLQFRGFCYIAGEGGGMTINVALGCEGLGMVKVYVLGV